MAVLQRRSRSVDSGSAAGRVNVPLREPGVMKRIAETAYYLWEKRGRPHGSDMQDWIEAERIVLARKD
jgi:hypothetical protein